jgi:radical SAM protein with 4Fe4S-binding SPASM domain
MMREKDCLGTEQSDIARYFSKARASRIPLAASFELTRRCNFRCVHCYLGDQKSIRQHKDRELDTDTIFRLLDEMVEAGTLFLLLTGGDPMLRPDFIDIYKYAVRAGLLVTVFCNGSLVTDEIIRTFVEYPPRILEITVYGATQETFEAVTQQPGSFSACMAGIERLRGAGVRLRLKTMVLTLNVGEFQALRQLAEDLDLQFRHDCSLHAAVAHEDNNGHSNVSNGAGNLADTLQYRLSPEQAAAVDLSIERFAQELAGVTKKKYPPQPTDQLYYCGAGKNSYSIDPYGGLFPCLVVSTHSGNVCDQGGIQTCWDGVFRAFTSVFFPCNTCGKKELCTACPAIFSSGSDGDPAQIDTFFCEYAEKRREKVLN